MAGQLIKQQVFVWVPVLYLLYRLRKRISSLWHSSTGFQLFLSFFLASVLVNLVMAAVPNIALRTTFISSVFAVISAMTLFSALPPAERPVPGRAVQILVILVGGWLIFSMGKTGYLYHTLYAENEARIAFILQERERGNLDVVVPPFSVGSGKERGHVFTRDIVPDEKDWVNASVAKYFRLHSIRASENGEGR